MRVIDAADFVVFEMLFGLVMRRSKVAL